MHPSLCLSACAVGTAVRTRLSAAPTDGPLLQPRRCLPSPPTSVFASAQAGWLSSAVLHALARRAWQMACCCPWPRLGIDSHDVTCARGSRNPRVRESATRLPYTQTPNASPHDSPAPVSTCQRLATSLASSDPTLKPKTSAHPMRYTTTS